MNGYESMQQWLSDLKQLTPNEYLTAEKDAEKLVLKDLGEIPTKDDYKREGDGFNPIMIMIAIIFISGLAISSFEAFKFVGLNINSVIETSNTFVYGIPINYALFVSVSQIAYLILAETSMISFIISWRFDEAKKRREGYYKQFKNTKFGIVRKFSSQFLSFKLFLALLSMSFILLANWSSGLHPLLALMPAFITIGVGYQFEQFYTEWFLEKQRINKEYTNDLNLYYDIKREPSKHPEFESIFKRSIWNRLSGKNRRSVDTDVNGEWKYHAVQREIENADWAKYAGNVIKAQNKHDDIDGDSSEISVLRTMMDDWNEGDNPQVRTQNYIVNMEDKTFHNLTTGEDLSRKSVAGLKKYVTSLIG